MAGAVRIHQLHFYRGVRLHLQWGHLLAMGGDLWCLRIESWWLSSLWSSSQVVKWHPIHQLVMSSPRTYMFSPNCTQIAPVTNKHPTLFYCISARRQWLRVNPVERMGLRPLLNHKAEVYSTGGPRLSGVQGSTLDSSILIVYPRFNQGKSFPLG